MDVFSGVIGIVVLMGVLLVGLRGRKKTSTVVVYKHPQQVTRLPAPQAVEYRVPDSVKVQGTPETIVIYMIVAFLVWSGLESWGDERLFAYLSFMLAGFFLFVHFSWGYFWARNPPRDAAEMHQDRESYKNRNAWAMLIILLVIYLIVRYLLHVPSNRPFF